MNYTQSFSSMLSWAAQQDAITTNTYPINQGFASDPPLSNVTLKPGTMLQRRGGIYGTYVAPLNTTDRKLSLPPDKIYAPLMKIRVEMPLEVTAGRVAPYYRQPGGGIQYLLHSSVSELGDLEYITIISVSYK